MNATLDDAFGIDLEYIVKPPKLSSYIYIEVHSTYNHSSLFEDSEKYGQKYYDSFGISKLFLYGEIKQGEPSSNLFI